MHKTRLRVILALAVCFTTAASEISSAEKQDFVLQRATRCTAEKCQLPNCRCSNAKLPKEEFIGQEKRIPQFVMVTFDDAVNTINYAQYEALFEDLHNPNDCAARGTFFVSHEYTDYAKVNALYTQGHEIALHSVTHGGGTDYWREASVEQLLQEFGDQMQMLEAYAGVNRTHIRGLRLPFLQSSGDNSYVAAQRLGLLYDSSWPTQRYKRPAMWPYTLDYRSVQDCQIGPCPKSAFPGFWVVPMVTWDDMQDYSCAMIDSCVYPPANNVDALFNWMLENFERHYNGSRAPFPMFLHAAWFARGSQHFNAMRKFLLHINTLPDVYITTISRVIQYMRHPVLDKPFKGCHRKPKATCKPRSCSLVKTSVDEMRYMSVCDRCPNVYPWLGNPLGQ